MKAKTTNPTVPDGAPQRARRAPGSGGRAETKPDEAHDPSHSPCGQYQICCSESAVRSLIVRLSKDDELYQRFRQAPRGILADWGIEVPPSVQIDLSAFERRHVRRIASNPGPLLNVTLGGRSMLKARGRPTPHSRASKPKVDSTPLLRQ